ncbi:MAG: hypothetical protein HFJ58_03415 [Clostridia bacterium]|nr:hypothetical protein [Clostridia bacterium]
MDTLYTGNIPEEYKFARFSDNSIDLFNEQNLENGEVYLYYRIPLYDNCFVYNLEVLNNTEYSTLTEVKTTNNVCYRRDFNNICTIILTFVIFGLFLFNIVTSIVRKGGVLGGLL